MLVLFHPLCCVQCIDESKGPTSSSSSTTGAAASVSASASASVSSDDANESDGRQKLSGNEGSDAHRSINCNVQL
jgi:hypothetical protein